MPVPAAVVGMSTGSAGGINTLSITCITPLLVATSAVTTLASLTITPLVKSKVRSSPLTAVATIPSLNALEGTLEPTTWYRSMSSNVSLPSGVSSAARSIPASVNAWSVGAKTVNGPSPCRVVNSSAWITAATSELCSPVHCAVRGISLGVSVGINTLSITCISPLLEMTSVIITLASFTITPDSPTVKDRG